MIEPVKTIGITKQDLWLDREGIISVLYGLKLNILKENQLDDGFYELKGKEVYNNGKLIKELTLSEENLLNSINDLMEYVRVEYKSII